MTVVEVVLGIRPCGGMQMGVVCSTVRYRPHISFRARVSLTSLGRTLFCAEERELLFD
jgi:hypothetical protein